MGQSDCLNPNLHLGLQQKKNKIESKYKRERSQKTPQIVFESEAVHNETLFFKLFFYAFPHRKLIRRMLKYKKIE